MRTIAVLALATLPTLAHAQTGDDIDGGDLNGYRATVLHTCPNFYDGDNAGILSLSLKKTKSLIVDIHAIYRRSEEKSVIVHLAVRGRINDGRLLEVLDTDIPTTEKHPLAAKIAQGAVRIANAALANGCNMAPEANRAYEEKLRENREALGR